MTTKALLGVGVDGAPGGWVAAAALGADKNGPVERSELHFFTTIAALSEWRGTHGANENAPAAVDIPIGLPIETEYRPCDREARDRLPGPRKSSVFMPPGRYLLAATEPIDGRRPNGEEVFARVQRLVRERREPLAAPGPGATVPAGIRGFSRQASGILLKIAEVDAFLAEGEPSGARPRQNWLFEVHPEICFQAMMGGQTPAPKASALGQLQRLDLVAASFPDVEERIRSWPGAGRYSLLDICDAYAALWTALRWRRHRAGAACHELDPPLEVLGATKADASCTDPVTGVPMRMVV